MKPWFLQVVSGRVKTRCSWCPSALPPRVHGPDPPVSLMYATLILFRCLLYFSSEPGQRGPRDWSLRSCVCRRKTDIQIVTKKLQEAPSLNLQFEFSHPESLGRALHPPSFPGWGGAGPSEKYSWHPLSTKKTTEAQLCLIVGEGDSSPGGLSIILFCLYSGKFIKAVPACSTPLRLTPCYAGPRTVG